MRPYSELVIQERNKLFRIISCLFAGGQMLELGFYFSRRWSHMETVGHFTVIELFLLYPVVALYSLKKNPDPFAMALFAYSLLTLTTILLVHPI